MKGRKDGRMEGGLARGRSIELCMSSNIKIKILMRACDAAAQSRARRDRVGEGMDIDIDPELAIG